MCVHSGTRYLERATLRILMSATFEDLGAIFEDVDYFEDTCGSQGSCQWKYCQLQWLHLASLEFVVAHSFMDFRPLEFVVVRSFSISWPLEFVVVRSFSISGPLEFVVLVVLHGAFP